MELNNLRNVLEYQKDRFIKKIDLIDREILQNIDNSINSKEIITINGVRRCGKSSVLNLISRILLNKKGIPPKNISYINFEDPKLFNFPLEKCDLLLQLILEGTDEKYKKYLFLDEVQNLQNWERWVNNLYKFENIKIFVTGSNSSILNSDISKLLTGRNRKYSLMPFSFREYINLKQYNFEQLFLPEVIASCRKSFEDYLKIGGFPEASKNNDLEILKSYYSDILYRDIIGRKQINHLRELIELSRYLISNPGCLASSEKLKKMLGLKTSNTIRNYIEVLKDSYLFFTCPLYDFSIKRQIYNPPKVYSIDTGLINAVSFSFMDDFSSVLKNIVYLELIKSFSEVYYWRSIKNYEVDFIVKEKNEIFEAIQVCYNLGNDKTRERKIRALVEAGNDFNIPKLKIITLNQEEIISVESKKIEIIPVWKWLLSTKGLQIG